jgi:hypothetical protein
MDSTVKIIATIVPLGYILLHLVLWRAQERKR